MGYSSAIKGGAIGVHSNMAASPKLNVKPRSQTQKRTGDPLTHMFLKKYIGQVFGDL